jgi:hypothetical protein
MIKFSLDAIIAPGRPVGNRMLFITLDGLRAIDGSTLNGPVLSRFATAFSPFYSNAMRVRLIAGEFLTDVPDDTVNQLVQYFSREADLMNFSPDFAAANPATYANYRSRWVTASTIVTLLSGSSVNGSMQKRLGDFMVKRDRAAQDLFKRQQKELQDLTDILQDGGNYGRPMVTGVKGLNHQDTPQIGRLWARPPEYGEQSVPGANTKELYARRADGKVQRRPRKTFRDNP